MPRSWNFSENLSRLCQEAGIFPRTCHVYAKKLEFLLLPEQALERGMKIRFSLHHAGRRDLAPIYERLNGCSEGAAARSLKGLLIRDQSGGMPIWFERLPRVPFSERRAKAIRFTILEPDSDPTTSELFRLFANMTSDEIYEFILEKLLRLANPIKQTEAVQPNINQHEGVSRSNTSQSGFSQVKAAPTPAEKIEGESVAVSGTGRKNLMSQKMKSFAQSANS
jgi:hypothetical protein